MAEPQEHDTRDDDTHDVHDAHDANDTAPVDGGAASQTPPTGGPADEKLPPALADIVAAQKERLTPASGSEDSAADMLARRKAELLKKLEQRRGRAQSAVPVEGDDEAAPAAEVENPAGEPGTSPTPDPPTEELEAQTPEPPAGEPKAQMPAGEEIRSAEAAAGDDQGEGLTHPEHEEDRASEAPEALQTDSEPETPVPQEAPERPVGAAPALTVTGRKAGLPVLPILLLINTGMIVFLAVMLLVALPRPQSAESQVVFLPADDSDAQRENAPGEADASRAAVDRPGSEVPATWETAELAYSQGRFIQAASLYTRLFETHRHVPEAATARDFYEFRIAQCLLRSSEHAKAQRLLLKNTGSASAVIRAAANYNLAVLDGAGGQHLSARRRAYRALAALGELQQAHALEGDCDFLSARAVTEKARSLHTDSSVVPWPEAQYIDPFVGLTEPGVRRLLDQGAAPPDPSEPASIEISSHRRDGRVVWRVHSRGASLADLLHQFAGRCGLDVRWDNVPESVRSQSADVYLHGASVQRVYEVACGLMGLMARFGWESVTVTDPRAAGAALSSQRELLLAEAASAWRRFPLRHPDDGRRAVGHFALGAIHEWAGDLGDAIQEYQLVARKFPTDEAAPAAMMRNARARMRLRDHAGAREVLLDLLDGYPYHPLADRVYLYLGEVSEEAGFDQEAVDVYQKLHYLNLSPRSRIEACLGAARGLFRLGEYARASRWLERYLEAARSVGEADLPGAYHLLGRAQAAVGNLPAAAAACEQALAHQPRSEQRQAALLTYARVQLDRGEYVSALQALERLREESLDEQGRYERLTLAARLYRETGVPAKAVTELRRAIPHLADVSLRARLGVEIARAHAEQGEWEATRLVLLEAVGKLPAGVEAERATCDLAEACLKAGRTAEAVRIARELYHGDVSESVREQARGLLVAAHVERKEYEAAAQAMASAGTAKEVAQ